MNTFFRGIERNCTILPGGLRRKHRKNISIDLGDFPLLQFIAQILGDETENILPGRYPCLNQCFGIRASTLHHILIKQFLNPMLRNSLNFPEKVTNGRIVINKKHDSYSSSVVTISTSSKVVTPAITFRYPSSRMDRIPISRAFLRSSTMLTLL